MARRELPFAGYSVEKSHSSLKIDRSAPKRAAVPRNGVKPFREIESLSPGARPKGSPEDSLGRSTFALRRYHGPVGYTETGASELALRAKAEPQATQDHQ